MISAVFVDRPRLAIVIAIVTTLAGAIALLRMPSAQFPDIVPPSVNVTTTFKGASAAVVEASVGQPLEAQVNGVDQMIYMKSNSGNDGSYGLQVTFNLGTDPDINTVNVNNRVQAALSKLPPEVIKNGVTVAKRSTTVLQFMQFYSEGNQIPPLEMSNYITVNLLDRLARVEGIGAYLVFGAEDYSIRLWLDSDRLTNLNLSPSDVINALQAQNVQAAVGRIGAQPAAQNLPFQINLQTLGRLTTPDQFDNIVLRANPDGSTVRIKDIGHAELGAATLDTESRLDGNPAVTLGLFLAPGANAVATSKRVSLAIAQMAEKFPPSLKSYIIYDASAFVSDTIDKVLQTLLEAFGLVVLVVFLSLGSLRATIIPTVAVPVSLIGTFIILLGHGLLHQHRLAARDGAGDRHRRRRRDRGRGERRTGDGRKPGDGPQGGDQGRDAPDHRPGDRDLARAAVRFRAGRVPARPLRHHVPSVRRNRQRCDDHLGDQRAHALAGTVRVGAASSGSSPRYYWNLAARHRPGARRIRMGHPPRGPGRHLYR